MLWNGLIERIILKPRTSNYETAHLFSGRTFWQEEAYLSHPLARQGTAAERTSRETLQLITIAGLGNNLKAKVNNDEFLEPSSQLPSTESCP